MEFMRTTYERWQQVQQVHLFREQTQWCLQMLGLRGPPDLELASAAALLEYCRPRITDCGRMSELILKSRTQSCLRNSLKLPCTVCDIHGEECYSDEGSSGEEDDDCSSSSSSSSMSDDADADADADGSSSSSSSSPSDEHGINQAMTARCMEHGINLSTNNYADDLHCLMLKASIAVVVMACP